MLIALMMEVARTSETLVNFYQTTRRYNPEDSHLLVITMIKSRTTRHVARIEKMRNAYVILVGKCEGKRPLGRHGTDRKIILKWIFKKQGYEDVTWMQLDQCKVHGRTLVNTPMNHAVP
jgi:hypothetical protein